MQGVNEIPLPPVSAVVTGAELTQPADCGKLSSSH